MAIENIRDNRRQLALSDQFACRCLSTMRGGLTWKTTGKSSKRNGTLRTAYTKFA